jgi:hypothetical protein
MLLQMAEVCSKHRLSLRHDALCQYPPFIIRLCFAGLDPHGSARALPHAGSESVAEKIADLSRLALLHLERTFRTSGNAQGTSRAELFVNPYHLSLHMHPFSFFLYQ